MNYNAAPFPASAHLCGEVEEKGPRRFTPLGGLSKLEISGQGKVVSLYPAQKSATELIQ
jgi:hypothetical protein